MTQHLNLHKSLELMFFLDMQVLLIKIQSKLMANSIFRNFKSKMGTIQFSLHHNLTLYILI